MVIATGFFDGVHLGHRFLLRQLILEAGKRGDESMVVTFWPHPRNVLQNDARNLRLLTSMDEKTRMLEELGINHIEVIPFTREFCRLTTRQFLQNYIIDRYDGRTILVGYDNRIGSDLCTPQQTASIATELGLEVVIPSSYASPDGLVISSTKIRNLIHDGNIEAANAMLGYKYQLFGVVVSGNRLGRTIGFPTANLQLYEPLKLVPGHGVYLVNVEALGRDWYGMCNIGTRPTIGSGNSMTIETNIFGFNEDIYGLDLRLTFLKKIRDEVRFDDLPSLAAQLARDKEYCIEQFSK